MRFVLCFLYSIVWTVLASGAELRLYPGRAFHVLGDRSDEWRFQTSTNLSDWSDAPELGTMFSDSSVRSLTNGDSGSGFLRAVRTQGLFDDRVLRTFRLTFAMTNWQKLLADGWRTGSNTLCHLELDNGLAILDVGARDKGFGSFFAPGPKKSINLEIDFVHRGAELMSQTTINLNNAIEDPTVMREPIYFNIKSEFVPSPRGSIARLFINNEYWGVYSLAQQENSVLIEEWFPSSDGDRWRTPNVSTLGWSDLTYISNDIEAYYGRYELRTENSTNAWQRLTNAIFVLGDTERNLRRDRYENVFAVDRWLWSFAFENVFADQDSYFFKGADYSFYYESESGRIHPIEHDGSEAFFVSFVNVSPVAMAGGGRLPTMLQRMLGVDELRQRYLAHVRTILEERFNPDYLSPIIDRLRALSIADVAADTMKNYSMILYTNKLIELRTFVTNRFQFLTNHPEIIPLPPKIVSVDGPQQSPTASGGAVISAHVTGDGTNGVNSVWLYWRTQSFGRFASMEMFDDGAHSDAFPGDGIYGALVPKYPAGTMVRYYVEARSANTTRTAAFSPARAEQVTYSYRVRLGEVSDSPVVINELMAENTKTVTDPQGEYEDWIELYNSSDQVVDLSGWYLSDDVNNPRKCRFPAGTRIEGRGYLLVWADEDGLAPVGLHANFKLSKDGEELFLVDSDQRQNRVLDRVLYGKQGADYSHGRDAADPSVFKDMEPSPGEGNR